ncbi:MAG TPA: chromosomal replication initiator protein DnaA [Chakrabartia sp.]|jgi:chromosomal replication initiator protein|nr:chromosomal replication initiator protein DnaA [Chakrabartia sp.]
MTGVTFSRVGDAAGLWPQVRALLRDSMGARSFDHWLRPVGFAAFEDGVVILAAPSTFTANWIRTHHADRLLQAWRSLLPEATAIRIDATSDATQIRLTPALPDAEPAPAPAQNAPAADAQSFDARFRFETFVTGTANQVAANAARAVATGGRLSFNPLYIHAATGQGKTHLLQAIGAAHQAAHPGQTVLYMSAERFMYDFVSAMRARETLAFKARLRSASLLMIDDVQFIAGKESTQEEFLHTVDELIGSGGKLVIGADRPPHALDGVEGRILSRLTQGLVVDIKPADFALRRAIVEAKAAAIPGVTVPDDVLDLLATRIVSNIRELEGGLNRLAAYASLGDASITAAFAEDVLAEMFRASKRRITIDEIQKRVSDHFRIRQAEMVSARRAREVARPRQIAMYLAKQLTPRSLPEIGRRFGGRDHTTVIHAVRQIEKLRGLDHDLDNDVRTLMRSLEG